MVIFLICILAAIIVIALYLTIHRVFLKRATMMVQKNAQDVTDASKFISSCVNGKFLIE